MKLVGCMPVRNESWVLGLSARVALMWCDHLILYLHACTDDSKSIARKIAIEHGDRVTLVTRFDPDWAEMAHRQSMLQHARKAGATHLAIIDADEILTGNLVETFRTWTLNFSDQHILQLPGYNLRGSLNRYHSNGIWGNRWFSTVFKDSPDLGWSGDRFHQREPGPRRLIEYQPIKQGEGGVLHLWGANERRLRAKHRAYRIQERLRWPQKPAAEIERMYSWATDGDPGNAAFGTPDTWTYADVPYSWWRPYESLMAYLDLPQIPWQEAWCDEMIQKYGKETFHGLSV